MAFLHMGSYWCRVQKASEGNDANHNFILGCHPELHGLLVNFLSDRRMWGRCLSLRNTDKAPFSSANIIWSNLTIVCVCSKLQGFRPSPKF